MSEWKEYKLGELVNLSQGQVINSKTNHLIVKDGIPLLRITDMLNGTKTIFIDPEKVAKKNIAFQDELIYTRTGQVGLVFMNQHGVVHNNSFKVVPKDDTVVYRKFLFWYLKSNTVYEYINGVASGSAQPDLTHDSFKSLTIKLPTLPTQQKIAKILSAYDELIEVNNERIKLLEETAQALYKEWFVRFRFPNYQQTEFIKGVPKGWEILELKSIVKITMGQSPKSEFYNETGEGLPFHQGVGSYGDRFPKHETFCSVSGRLANEGDILFSVRAPVGRLNIADRKLIIGRGLSAIRHLKEYNNYLFYMLKSEFVNEDIIGNGSIFNSVTRNEIETFKVNYSEEIAEKFDDFINPIDTQIETLQQQNTELRQIRDRLLPRLISGKLSIL